MNMETTKLAGKIIRPFSQRPFRPPAGFEGSYLFRLKWRRQQFGGFLVAAEEVGDKVKPVGEVGEVFRKPATAFVAAFVGMKNIFSITERGECFLGAGLRFAVSCESDSGCVALRPEDVFVARERVFPTDWISLPGLLKTVRHEGFSWFAEVSCGQACFTAAAERQFLADGGLEQGTPVWLGFASESLHFMSRE